LRATAVIPRNAVTRHAMPTSPSSRDLTAVILAAGEGRRLGGIAKAFLELGGYTLLQHAVKLVEPLVDHVVIGVRECDLSSARKQIHALGAHVAVEVVAGGATRQETLRRLIAATQTRFLLIHEVARPWAEPTELRRVISALGEHDAVVSYTPIPVRDSIALCHDGVLDRALPRSDVVTLKTPHGYRRSVLEQAYALAAQNGWEEDSTAALVMRTATPVHVVEGSPHNVKITYPEDLVLLASGEKAAASPALAGAIFA
jgi:2-C-methyl-D-erythritol 4-phosphate cytidylyltransferase